MITRTFTIDSFKNYITSLPREFKIAAEEINTEMAKSLQRRIRIRAPIGSTGSLKETEIQSKGNKLQLLGPGHWSYVNAGVAPMKWLPLEVAREHQAFPGSTAGKSVNLPNNSIDGWFFAGYTEGKGFVDNSIISLNKDIQPIVEKAISKVLQNG